MTEITVTVRWNQAGQRRNYGPSIQDAFITFSWNPPIAKVKEVAKVLICDFVEEKIWYLYSLESLENTKKWDREKGISEWRIILRQEYLD